MSKKYQLFVEVMLPKIYGHHGHVSGKETEDKINPNHFYGLFTNPVYLNTIFNPIWSMKVKPWCHKWWYITRLLKEWFSIIHIYTHEVILDLCTGRENRPENETRKVIFTRAMEL